MGNSGDNRLDGKAGDDSLSGGEGSDKLIGGAGADKLYGGTGADTFVFLTAAESRVSIRDIIYDFSRVGGDKIDLSAIDARTAMSGNQAFTFIGSDLFSKTAGELRYSKISGDSFIYGDVNGDGGIDFSIRLDAAIDMKASDFIL
ncbi:M10 family metallopeptidase C-terminal domain-containing protein [Shinella curvata]|uniref:M10 family metallopeptidase C-terminal domain-containing protein n=1 Tax=Shinella curvata TaxID=1817964 RepID=A0ABT8XN87_9HYPH|nr:M10 family metallopeptidase C-terminal domain-containing protein [Shinella curvata]MDO6125197.1 M10 family metallopeptidase C-terminal domain-containing protein [Shinella curvata]